MQLAERITPERIAAEAREIHVGRILLTLVAGIFYVLGWTAGKLVLGAGAVIAWSIAAAKVGWQDARRPPARRASGSA